MEVIISIGTRAELIKTAPFMLELQRRGHDYYFISTGQHNLKPLCKEFGVRPPDEEMTEPQKGSSKFLGKTGKAIVWNISLVKKIRRAVNRINKDAEYDYVVYHGDTMSTTSSAIATSRALNPGKKYKNVHLEAGLRSHSILEPFPEEISRIYCDLFSDVLIAVTDTTVKNLSKPWYRGEIVKAGNTIVDAAHLAYKISKKKRFKRPKGKYVLANVHRHENIKSKNRLSRIVDIINMVPVRVIWPLHDNTKKYLIKYGLWEKIERNKNIKITKLKGYFEFVYLIKHAKLLITDGGGIQEESLAFKVPALLVRKRTERVEGLSTGINFLTKLDLNYSKKVIDTVLNKGWKVPKFKNPYGEPGVTKLVVKKLEEMARR